MSKLKKEDNPFAIKKIIKKMLTGKLVSPREYTINHECKVFYLVNPKVACSSIKASVFNIDVKDDYSVHKIRNDNRVLFYDGFLNIEDYFGFTYVRNPFSRLVSCYESKYHSDVDKYHIENKNLDEYLFGFMKKDKGFKSFLIKVLIIPKPLADMHFKSQYKLIYNKGNRVVDYVGKIEEIDTYKQIANKYKLPELKHFNTSKQVNYKNYYSTLLTLLTYIKFRKDIKHFDYINEYKDLLNYTIKNRKYI